MTDRNKIEVPHLLLVSGNGRNSGKTLFVRKLIEKFSPDVPVTGIKISPHFHWVDTKSILLKTGEFIICEENETTQKDSSLMRQSGADKVYFVMTKQENIRKAFRTLQYLMTPTLIICESGGLHMEVEPGVHFFVRETGTGVRKDFPNSEETIIVNRTKDSSILI